MGRFDLDVYNEATGFLIASESVSQGDFADVEPGGADWRSAVKAGRFLPFQLVQDDPFLIRVVVNEPLTRPEREEWVGRFAYELQVPDGRLAVVGGGPEYLWGEDMEEYTRVLDIPAGTYRAEVYTYLHGVNGRYCLAAADADEPLGAYFRRTRPGTPFPLWLRNDCASNPALDPGHADEWRGVQPDYDAEQPDYVGFLLRLSPPAESPALPDLEDGWFAIVHEARKPAACPLGLVADRTAEAAD